VENRGWKSFRILLDLPNHVSGAADWQIGEWAVAVSRTLSDSIRQLPARRQLVALALLH